MAEYRTVHTKMWKDEWFTELRPDAKLLFVYLVTNPAASVAGIYKLPPKFIAFETGIRPARVTALLDEFQQAGKVYHDGEVIWVKNLRAYQTYHGEATRQVQIRIEKDLAEIPDSTLKRAYLAYYATGAEPPIPTAYPPDTHPIPTGETDTDTETETEKETETRSAGAGAPHRAEPKAKKVEPDEPAAVKVFLDNGGRLPSGDLVDGTPKSDRARAYICEHVKDTPDSLAFWGRVVDGYQAHWSPKSYTVMVNDYYLRGRVPGQANGGGNGTHRTSNGAGQAPIQQVSGKSESERQRDRQLRAERDAKRAQRAAT